MAFVFLNGFHPVICKSSHSIEWSRNELAWCKPADLTIAFLNVLFMSVGDDI
jgi:hypothetical protein